MNIHEPYIYHKATDKTTSLSWGPIHFLTMLFFCGGKSIQFTGAAPSSCLGMAMPGDREGKHFETQGTRGGPCFMWTKPQQVRGFPRKILQVVERLWNFSDWKPFFGLLFAFVWNKLVCYRPLKFQPGLNPSIGFWFQARPSNNLRYLQIEHQPLCRVFTFGHPVVHDWQVL